MNTNQVKKLILSALFAALCCISTMVITIPTITGGYINIGDTFVISSGIFLGPIYGALAAGIGSMLSDVFLGYLSYAPATFLIKFLAAFTAALIFCSLRSWLSDSASSIHSTKKILVPVLCGCASSIIVVVGYFLYEWLLTDNMFAAAFSGITGNLVQGLVSTILATLLFPVLQRLNQVYNS